MTKASITRQRILDAAVQLLAGEDIYHRLSLDMIAEKTGLSHATIRYHFGTKAGFVDALWDSIVEIRRPHTLEVFYRRHKSLLESRDGQLVFIHQMLHDYSIFFRGDDEEKRRKIRLFFQENMNFSQKPSTRSDEYLADELRAFHVICHEICGIIDPNETSLWFMFIMHPVAICFSYPVSSCRPENHLRIRNFEEQVLGYAEQQLLACLGLQPLSPAITEDSLSFQQECSNFQILKNSDKLQACAPQPRC